MTIETKYNVGDEVWIEVKEQPAKGYIKAISVRQEIDKPLNTDYQVSYTLSPLEPKGNYEYVRDSDIHLTIEDYINNMWTPNNCTVAELRKRMNEF